MQCPGCKFLYVSPLPSREDIEKYYNAEEYYSEYTTEKWKRWNISHHFLRKFELIERYCDKGALLDVGCADGLFLSLAVSRGWDTTGIDISQELASQASNNFGIKVHCGTLFSANFESESFDVVTLIHNLEHSPDPRSIVAEVNRILKPGGYIYIAVPNLDERTRRVISALLLPQNTRHRLLKIASGICPPDHLCTFSTSSLNRLLEETGFRVLKRIYVNRIRPLFISPLKVWLTLQSLSLVNVLLRTGLHIEVLARKQVSSNSS